MDTKCVIRTERAGVHYGSLRSRSGSELVLGSAIRIHCWDGACSLSQLAVDGPAKPENCRFSVVVPEITLLGVIEIIPCSSKAIECIEGVKSWKV